jgi:hypothetical protein
MVVRAARQIGQKVAALPVPHEHLNARGRAPTERALPGVHLKPPRVVLELGSSGGLAIGKQQLDVGSLKACHAGLLYSSVEV